MKLQGAVAESTGSDASALELEEEAQPRPQQVVQVFHRECRERVRVERRGGAAAQAGEQVLLEQALSCFIEHAQLARRSDQVGELVKQPRAGAVERAYPGAVQHFRAQLRT